MDYKATEDRTRDMFSLENPVVEPETETVVESNTPDENQQERVETEHDYLVRLWAEEVEEARRASTAYCEAWEGLFDQNDPDARAAYFAREAELSKNVAAIFLGMLALGLNRTIVTSIIEEYATESKNGAGEEEFLGHIIGRLYESGHIEAEKPVSYKMETYLRFIMDMAVNYHDIIPAMNSIRHEGELLREWSIINCPDHFADNFQDDVFGQGNWNHDEEDDPDEYLGADDVLRGGNDTDRPEHERIFDKLNSMMTDAVLFRLIEPTNKNRRLSPGSPESFFYQLAEEHQNVYIKDQLDKRCPDNWSHKLLWGLSRGYYLNERCYDYYKKYGSDRSLFYLNGVFPRDKPVVLEDEDLFTYWIERSDGWSMDEISDPCMNALYVEEFRKEETLYDTSSLQFIHEGIRPLSDDEFRKLNEYYYGPAPVNELSEEYSEGQPEDELDEQYSVHNQWSKKPEKITPNATLQRTVSEPLDKPRNKSVSVYAGEDFLAGGNHIKTKIMVGGGEVELTDPYANGGEDKVDPQLIPVWYYTELEVISRKLYAADYESQKYFRGRVNLREYTFGWPDMDHGSETDVSGFVTGLMMFLIIIKDADVKTIVSKDIFEYLPDGCVTYSDVNGRRQKREYFEFEITEDFSLKIFLPPTYRGYIGKDLIKGVIGAICGSMKTLSQLNTLGDKPRPGYLDHKALRNPDLVRLLHSPEMGIKAGLAYDYLSHAYKDYDPGEGLMTGDIEPI